MKLSVELQSDGYWMAIDLNDYEGESDSTRAWCNSPVGYGKNMWDAIEELLELIKEKTNA